MSNDEAKQAFVKQVPVVHNCHCSRSLIVYKRIRKLIWDIRSSGEKVLECALTDEKESVLVYALPADLAFYDESKPITRENYFNEEKGKAL